jgi:hypothetical protein
MEKSAMRRGGNRRWPIVAIVALVSTLLLTGFAAAPASALPPQPVLNGVMGFVRTCSDIGGSPDIEAANDGGYLVRCDLPGGGGAIVCTWASEDNFNQQCYYLPVGLTRPTPSLTGSTGQFSNAPVAKTPTPRPSIGGSVKAGAANARVSAATPIP